MRAARLRFLPLSSALLVLASLGCKPGFPDIHSFTATPSQTMGAGAQATLAWDVDDATSLTIDQGVGDVTNKTSIVVTPAQTTTYTLTATNSHGHAPASVTVTVPAEAAPVINSFTATPDATTASGQSVTLGWDVSGADLHLTIDQAVGDVTGQTTAVVTPAATTTYQLTAKNSGGIVMATATVTVTAVVVTADDRFADAVHGLDTNDCTHDAPCLTINRAITHTSTGHTVYLFDGTYATATQGGDDITLADGISLSAVNPGAAKLNGPNIRVVGSSTITGIELQGVANVGASAILANATTGTPTLSIVGVRFTYVESLILGGSVHATMTPGALAGGVYTANLPDGYQHLIELHGTSSLLVEGGIIDGNNKGAPAYGAGLIAVTDSASLTLDGATLRNLTTVGILAGNSGATTTTVTLRNNTHFDTVGALGANCAASAAVVLSGVNTFSMDHVSFTNLPGTGVCQRSEPWRATVSITNSSFDHVYGPVGAEDGGALVTLTMSDTTITSCSYGVGWHGATGSTLSFNHVTITGSLTRGMWFFGDGAVKVRNTSVTGTVSGDGVRVENAWTYDLGTSADPGLNTFSGNSAYNLHVSVDAGVHVNAIGNTWDKSVDNADANGHYSVAPSYTPVPVNGPSAVNTGRNAFVDNAATVSL